jgi:hypothetical protein
MIHDSVLENSHKFDLAVILVVVAVVAVVVCVEKTLTLAWLRTNLYPR